MSYGDVNPPIVKRSKTKNEKLTLMDLPDEILSKIICNLDLPSRFKMRVNRRLNRIELGNKNRIEKLELNVIKMEERETSFSVKLEESNGLESVGAEDKTLEDLMEGMKRMANNVHCNSIIINTAEEVSDDMHDLIRIVAGISNCDFKISPTFDDDIDEDDRAELGIHPTFDKLDYNFLLSICEERDEIDIGFNCDSLSVQDWIQIRQKMLSREISVTSLNVLMDESIAGSLLFAISGVKFEWQWAVLRIPLYFRHLVFYTNDDGKKVIYKERERFSILFFDGLLLTEFYGGHEFGMRLKWLESEKEVAKIRKDYKVKNLVAQPDMIPLGKKRVNEIHVVAFIVESDKADDTTHSLSIEDNNGLRPVVLTLRDTHELKKILTRLAKFSTCNKISLETQKDVHEDVVEILKAMLDIEADEIEIKPKGGFGDDDENSDSPSHPLSYDLLLSMCETKEKVDIKFEAFSIEADKWIELRQKMLSREISLTSLDVLMDESDFVPSMLALHGVSYVRKRRGFNYYPIKFYSNEVGKSVLYDEYSFNGTLSIVFFDGLFLNEFYSFRRNRFDEDRYGIRMKWFETEDEVEKEKEKYKTKTALKL